MDTSFLKYTLKKKRLFEKPLDKNILLVGPRGSGKTTLLYLLKMGKIMTTMPSLYGMPNMETVELGNRGDKLNFIDYCGDEEVIRHNVDAVIFMCTSVKDSSTQQKIMKLLSNVSACGKPVLILENKCDGLVQEELDLIEDYDSYVKEKQKTNPASSDRNEYRWLLGDGAHIYFSQISCYSQGGVWESFSWLISRLQASQKSK